MRKNNKGVAVVWIHILIMLFVIGMVYILFSWVLFGTNGIYNLINASSAVNNSQAQSTMNIIIMAWQYFPLPFVIGLILYGLVSSQKREPDSYYL